jgi:hypothetical protein
LIHCLAYLPIDNCIHSPQQKWMCKDISASTIMMAALTVIALVYAIESKRESALANELTRREACRSHPVSLWPRVALPKSTDDACRRIPIFKTRSSASTCERCTTMTISMFTRISNHLDWPSDIQIGQTTTQCMNTERIPPCFASASLHSILFSRSS